MLRSPAIATLPRKYWQMELWLWSRRCSMMPFGKTAMRLSTTSWNWSWVLWNTSLLSSNSCPNRIRKEIRAMNNQLSLFDFSFQEVTVPVQSSDVGDDTRDRKSTRLNSSHSQISYAVFC